MQGEGQRPGKTGKHGTGTRVARRRRAVCVLASTLIAQAVGSAERPVVTVPTETFRAQAVAEADTGPAAQPREPLAAQLVYRLPAPMRAERSRTDDADADGPMVPVQQVGIGRDIAQRIGTVPDSTALQWVSTTDGGLATAVGLASPGAQALRVRLVIEGAPRGLDVRVYDAAATPETVAAVPAHQLPAVEGGSSDLWTPTVSGEAATVELYLPPGTAAGDLKVSIPVLSHLDVDPIATRLVSPRPRCSHRDVACATDEVSDATRRAVASYVYTSRYGHSSQCSGTLLNDAEHDTQIPYFLTARHCVETQQEASSMEFYWFYESDTCGGPAPQEVTRQSGGATELAHASEWAASGLDQLLLRLNTDPPAGVGLAGWTTAGTSWGDKAVGVHHPKGIQKKLARHSVGGLTQWRRGGVPSHIFTQPDINFEAGSSGSGLFKRIDGADYLIGVASGHNTSKCHGDIQTYFGRFDSFYPMVSRWLGAPEHFADSGRFKLTRLALVDGATRAEVADLLAGDALVDLDTTSARSFDIVAEMNIEVGGVALTMAGPRSASHASDLGPYSLFGPGGGGGLAAGSYRVQVIAYGQGLTDGTRVLEKEVAFEVTGGADDSDTAVAGLALVIGGGPRVVELADGARVTVYAGETVKLRARTTGGGVVGSVAFALSGAGTLTATTNEAPFTVPTTLRSGTYRIAATPYAAADGAGDAGTALSVSGVTVTVAPAAPVSGFTLVDARGGLPDADIGALSDGGTVDLERFDGWASVRANLAESSTATRVALALDGPRAVARTEPAGGIVSLFGDSGGDYVAGAFPSGGYTLTATPYAGPAPRDVLPATTVAFTVTRGLRTPVTVFTLIDAGGGPPDPDIATIADGATVSLSPLATKRSGIRADLAYPGAAGSVRLELRGPVSATRTANDAPYLLFGGSGDDVYGEDLPNGTYTLRARPFSRRDGSGDPLPPLAVTFTLVDSPWPQTLVSGFTLIDATGGRPTPTSQRLAKTRRYTCQTWGRPSTASAPTFRASEASAACNWSCQAP